jgi:nucleotide-binding universal stress UspA family protein
MIHHVLVPLDGSPFAERALPFALAVARRSGAFLDLVRVHVVYAMQPTASSWLPYDAELEQESRQLEQDYLDEVAGRVAAAGGTGVTRGVADGLSVDGILSRAHEQSADLIVMTTHGAGPISRAFLGSTADELVRRSPTPLLLIQPQEVPVGLGGEPSLSRLLIPLDGSALAEQILGPAADLARLTGASVTLLHVNEPARRSGAAQARPYLEGVAERLRRQGLKVQTFVVSDSRVVPAILGAARAADCDLIALATHGRGGLRRLLLGSVADKILRAAACPLLVLRPACENRPAEERPEVLYVTQP